MFETKPDMGKDFAFISRDGKKVSWHSVEFLHSEGRNRWKGWYCSAGIQSLYIDFDGNVFSGTCEVGGWYGNVFKGPHHDSQKLWLDTRWKQCAAEACQCGSDMYSPKVKSKDLVPSPVQKDMGEFFDSVAALKPERVDLVDEPGMIVSGALRYFKLLLWDLGRRCNYDCSYCFSEVHNNFEAHKSLGSLKQAVDFIHRYWKQGWRIKWVITGGEPTVNPNYLDLVRHIKAPLKPGDPGTEGREVLPDAVHTTTNGSRDPEFFSELMRLSDIGFSGHLEYLKDRESSARFVANVRECVAVRRNDADAALNWLGIRIMLKPGLLDVARVLRDQLVEIPGLREHAHVNFDLLHEKTDKSHLLPYNEAEVAFATSPFGA